MEYINTQIEYNSDHANNYYEKYIKYKIKYLNLKHKLNSHFVTPKNDLIGGYFNVPKYAFSNDSNNKDILKWYDDKSLHIIDDKYIYLSSAMICPYNFSKHFNIEYCSIPSFKLHNLLSNIDDEYYVICINYVNSDGSKDFQFGITESINYNETDVDCVRRGIIEEIGLSFNNDELNIGKQSETYIDGVKCYINKLSDLELYEFNETTNLGLNGGIFDDSVKKCMSRNVDLNKYKDKYKNKYKCINAERAINTSNDVRKISVFLYDSLSNIIKYLSKRYVSKLNQEHYIIDGKTTINKKKLYKTNLEKKNLELYLVSIYDIKSMLQKIYDKNFTDV